MSENSSDPTIAPHPPDSTSDNSTTTNLRLSGALILGGLTAEALSMLGLKTPIGFIGFTVFGGSLITAGVVYFLWTVVSRSKS